MSFGFSVGDFIAVGKLIADISSCLKDVGGSKTEYQDLIRELDCLQKGLAHLDKFQPSSSTIADSIKYSALSCRRPLEEFLGKLKRYDSSLGDRATGRSWKAPVDKVRFMLGHSEDVRKLQSYLSVHVGTLNILLAEHGLESMDIESKKSEADRLHVRGQLDHTNGVLMRVQSTIVQQVAELRRAGSMLEAVFRMVSGEMKASWRSIENSVATVCVSTQQIYSVVLEIRGFMMTRPDCRWTFFQDPVMVEDALGLKFPVPSEYDFELLDQIIRYRFRTGPGSTEVGLGDYQVMESRRSSTILSAESRIRPGSSLIMAILIGKPPSDVSTDRSCPMPRCTSTETNSVEGGGRVCCNCNVWFSETEKKRESPIDFWIAMDSSHESRDNTPQIAYSSNNEGD
ncbi:uncharacterized protein DNG_02208 [Cephalotrichum gorgonifer]|uniref:Ubiquitin-like domain-containing protein n=1 Tax=Cephalotrichum gorgonifer TaxID=2041049 RepID=A0AAE8MSK7_9PEZI|nr:uncharacterized protein DNG_02208 [Cephalotrichum gorgonifer]